ncbi:hypothetical protein JCGZ_03222 [Jatropha curcas]|uniref:Uncharacterized protein n=1 Tax=Jatropha curcas TaxID=180498 RepID=A0A067KY50_JATCU|nr:hypothetical protein JCGZ_03222 [Jatropha curcas]
MEKSITVKVGDVPEDEDEQLQLAIQKSLADHEEQWYYSSEEEVNEVGVQSLTHIGRVYNPENNMQAKGKEIAVDGAKKKMTEKGVENPKEKKKEEEIVKGQKKAVEVGETSQNKTLNGVWVGSCKEGLSLFHQHPGSKTNVGWGIRKIERRKNMRFDLRSEGQT